MILVTGGCRSGKSKFAEKFAEKYKRVLYIATAIPYDDEMEKRIEIHKSRRPQNWDTYEGYRGIENILRQNSNKYDCILLECITVLITNIMFSLCTERDTENADFLYLEERIYTELKGIAVAASQSNCEIIFVTNEIGLGVVPENRLARNFRDIAGRVNCTFAEMAQSVYLIVSGIDIKIK